MTATTPVTVGAALSRADALAVPGSRRLLGIAGAPGGGKTTLAEHVVSALDGRAVDVPMDGFHLADVQLDALGRRDRKGAVDTFDGAGYVALLRRLRDQPADETVYAPAFQRPLEQPIAGSIAVDPSTPLVVTEGNYLLLDEEPWSELADVLDEIWWVDVDDDLRRERLIARHIEFGKAPDVARRWVADVDDHNAVVAASGRDRADVLVQLGTDSPVTVEGH